MFNNVDGNGFPVCRALPQAASRQTQRERDEAEYAEVILRRMQEDKMMGQSEVNGNTHTHTHTTKCLSPDSTWIDGMLKASTSQVKVWPSASGHTAVEVQGNKGIDHALAQRRSLLVSPYLSSDDPSLQKVYVYVDEILWHLCIYHAALMSSIDDCIIV